MKKRTYIPFIAYLFCFFTISTSFSQQLPIYSQYMINDYIINPAVAGKNNYFEAKSNFRYQWIGITDAPRTYIVSLNGSLVGTKVGLGGYLFADIAGPTRRIGVYGSYAYHLKLSDKFNLALALNGGLLQFAVDGTKISLYDVSDPSLASALQSVLLPDFGFGAHFYDSDKKYYLGISAPQLMQNRLKVFDKSSSSLSKLTTHLFITAGYKHALNDDFAIEPSAIAKYSTSTPIQVDLGLRAIYKNTLWAGAYFRTHDAIASAIGYSFEDYLSISYSYDFITSNIKKYSSGTHEIMLGIKFK